MLTALSGRGGGQLASTGPVLHHNTFGGEKREELKFVGEFATGKMDWVLNRGRVRLKKTLDTPQVPKKENGWGERWRRRTKGWRRRKRKRGETDAAEPAAKKSVEGNILKRMRP
jgi:hypothetical protein